ncbi:hypothetical protein M231_05572 [Tremella mesenterica]|uniref:CCHC-type domain-containing protein n=1 Tax=Tremella mesenterica TaxID=5217 RepID=A0A4Q1BHN4_TREME|nr:hypothetical protein M231_05572 [Tremella mesenterica]
MAMELEMTKKATKTGPLMSLFSKNGENPLVVQLEVDVEEFSEEPRLRNPPLKTTRAQEKAKHAGKLPSGCPKVHKTGRIASAGERAWGVEKPLPKCSTCLKPGHKSNKCPETAERNPHGKDKKNLAQLLRVGHVCMSWILEKCPEGGGVPIVGETRYLMLDK